MISQLNQLSKKKNNEKSDIIKPKNKGFADKKKGKRKKKVQNSDDKEKNTITHNIKKK